MGTSATGGGCGSCESGGNSGFEVACVRNLTKHCFQVVLLPGFWFMFNKLS